MSVESIHRFSLSGLFSRRNAAFSIAVAAVSVGCGSNDANDGMGAGGAAGFGGGTGGVSTGGAPISTGGVSPGTGGSVPSAGGTTPSAGGTVGMGGLTGSSGSSGAGGSAGAGGMDMSAGGASGAGGVGAGGAGGANTGGAGGGAGGMAPCVKGAVKASQVIMIGDSYIQIPGTLQGDIQTLARMGGAIGMTDTYRNYAVSGTSLGNGQISAQYTTAKNANKDIKVVIMDGGGNDVLLLNPVCLSAKPAASNMSCVNTVNTATMVAKTLAAQMATDGVEDMVYFFYPATPAVTGDILDYSEPMTQAFCSSLTKPRCHFVSTKAAFDGKQAQYIGPDGIHPTTAGAQVIAGLIWDKMKADCVAQ